jgi:hypothetical protein
VLLLTELSNQQLIEMGTKEIAETDRALERARQVVEDTIQIGAQVRLLLRFPRAGQPFLFCSTCQSYVALRCCS